jgi:hypothetical protein
MSTYTPIATLVLSAGTTKVTISNIPQTYSDLVLVGQITNSTSLIYGALQFNSDNSGTGGTAYSTTSLAVYNNGAASDQQSNTYGIASWEKTVASSTDTSNVIITVNDYANPNKHKTAWLRTGKLATNNLSGMNVGTWRNLQPITSISYDTATAASFGSGSTWNLYGINSGAITTEKATGGNIIVSDGTYWYHAFTSSGVFSTDVALTADILVVAGGGGTAGDAGGGGAGGLQTFTSQSLSGSTDFSVQVGAGGASPLSYGPNGARGNNSIFSTLAPSIGGGGSNFQSSGQNGGSGAGAGVSGSPGTGIAGQGFAGGSGGGGVVGGGGGAGGVGGNSGGGTGGNGGIGATSAFINTIGSAIGIAELSGGNYYFAGGGGGWYGGKVGGLGGGGNESSDADAFTGGGGGAYYGSGGSGIVVVRYAV